MSGIDERDRQVLEMSSNGDIEPESVEVDGQEYVRRKEFDALKQTVEDLEETIAELQTGVENAVQTAVEAREQAENRSGVDGEFTPDTKKGRVEKLIKDNFEEWSVSLKSGKAVVTKIQEKKRRARTGQNIHKYVRNAMDERYGEGVDHRQVHDALEDLGRTEQYRLEDTGSRKVLFKE